jgi:hypothetical protein
MWIDAGAPSEEDVVGLENPLSINETVKLRMVSSQRIGNRGWEKRARSLRGRNL